MFDYFTSWMNYKKEATTNKIVDCETKHYIEHDNLLQL